MHVFVAICCVCVRADACGRRGVVVLRVRPLLLLPVVCEMSEPKEWQVGSG